MSAASAPVEHRARAGWTTAAVILDPPGPDDVQLDDARTPAMTASSSDPVARGWSPRTPTSARSMDSLIGRAAVRGVPGDASPRSETAKFAVSDLADTFLDEGAPGEHRNGPPPPVVWGPVQCCDRRGGQVGCAIQLCS